MAELTVDQRKKAVRRQTKQIRRSMTKEQKAAKRREDLAAKQKKLSKRIKSTEGEKKKDKLQERKKMVKQRKSTTSQNLQGAKQTTKRLTKKREATSKYTTTTPGTEGVKNATIDPFLNSDQIADQAQKTNDYNDTLSNLQYAQRMQQTETDYNKQMVDKQKPYDLEKANSSAAGRGLFNSSIRDAKLYDIDATAAINKMNFDKEFESLRMDTERQAIQATNAFNSYKEAMNQAAVDNASAASEGMELYQVDPTAAVVNQHQVNIPDMKPIKPGNGPNNGRNKGGNWDRGGMDVTPEGNRPPTKPGGRPNPNPNKGNGRNGPNNRPPTKPGGRPNVNANGGGGHNG